MPRRIRGRILALIVCVCLLISICGCVQTPIDLDDVPDYCGYPYVIVNGNMPFFTEKEMTYRDFENYSPLDGLGRCGVAFACITPDTMPDEERDSIASITPSGWEYFGISNNNRYSFVENEYVYNRCHLIGFQLAGENDNARNLVTGTRYMNIEGMLPFENMIAEYVRATGMPVLYRVTPIFKGLNSVCEGILMEAWSANDGGEAVCFCIFVYNVQPGVVINYMTGENRPE